MKMAQGFALSKKELTDLTKAWFAISLAFAIVLGGLSGGIVYSFLIAALTVGVGFIFHELAHKAAAMHFGGRAEFRSFDGMLILAVLISLLGIVIAAPGAVMIRGQHNKTQTGIISSAGIAANILIAVVFLLLLALAGEGGLNTIGLYGLMINSWLALFNLIPFGNFDGVKIFAWNKAVYFTLAAAGVGLLFIGNLA